MSSDPPTPHSAAYFGPERDFWWNLDHLALIASRRGLEQVRSVLDVGCGVGHWGMLLASVLSPEASIVGVDREAEWVEAATRRAEVMGLAERCSYRQGAAESLPFDDASFDLVTCQTVLIHVPDASAVVREMLRVTKPGGQLIAAEPNSRAALLVGGGMEVEPTVEELVDVVRFFATCERGKIALGEGDNSVGDLLPGLFAQLGLGDVQAFISDKPVVMVPPYDTAEQRAVRAGMQEEVQAQTCGGWSRAEALRLFVAGGGGDEEFEHAWQRRLRDARDALAEIEHGTVHSAGGTIHYLVAGRRPPS